MGKLRALPVALALSFSPGCGGPLIEPASGPVHGHFQISVSDGRIAQLSGALRVAVGGIGAYAAEREGDAGLLFMVQGSPTRGPQPIVVKDASGVELELGSFEYLPPPDPRLVRLIATGASLTMGTQDGGITIHSQTMSPAAQLARAFGAYLSMPLARDGMFPGLSLEDFDPETCTLRGGGSATDLVLRRTAETLLRNLEGEDGRLQVSRARLDPELEVRDVAIGGFRLDEQLHGARHPLKRATEHFVWDPAASQDELFLQSQETMFDRVQKLAPAIVVSTDLIVNDYNTLDLSSAGIPDLSALTPLPEFRALLREALDRLDATGAEVFVATGPDSTRLSQYDDKVEALRAAGFGEDEATSWRQAVRDRIVAYNDALWREAEDRPRIHIVDAFAIVNEVVAQGLDVGSEHLEARPFGGLLSLDGMHLTDTGNAILANAFLRRMNEVLGLRVPEIDVAAVLDADPRSPARLREAGFGCAP